MNMSIANSCSEILIRNMMGNVSEVSKCLEHGKRYDKLAEVIGHEFPDVKKKQVNPL